MSISRKNQDLTISPAKAHDSDKPQPYPIMSQFDKIHLATNFENWKSERCPELPNCDAFEIYTIEQVLKQKDPSDVDIESGNLGGGQDGGVDGFYFYIDQKLVGQGTHVSTPAKSAEVIIVQSKS